MSTIYKDFMEVRRPSVSENFPFFARPTEIGNFSTDDNYSPQFENGRKAARYKPPPDPDHVSFDLNVGYENFIPQKSTGSLDNLLKWILEKRCRNSAAGGGDAARQAQSLKSAVEGANFISWRGLLTKLAATPYENSNSWTIGVRRFGNVLFLQESMEEHALEEAAKSDREKLMCYWGYCFERYVTQRNDGGSDQAENGDEPPSISINCNAQYCAVFRTKIAEDSSDQNSFRLLYGAEMDGVDDREGYFELKTSRILDSERQMQNFVRFKLMRWWLQAFLVAIHRVICGYRDDQGIVHFLKEYPVADMTKEAANKRFWSGAACFRFLLNVLKFINENMRNSSEDDVVYFEFDPRERKIHRRPNHGRGQEMVILPDWFRGAFA